jgi:hypothetical protein
MTKNCMQLPSIEFETLIHLFGSRDLKFYH